MSSKQEVSRAIGTALWSGTDTYVPVLRRDPRSVDIEVDGRLMQVPVDQVSRFRARLPFGRPDEERSLDGKYLLRLVPTDKGTCAERFLDERDQAIVDERMAAVNAIAGPRVGDFVLFADGTERRISYAWPAGDTFPASVQTSGLGAGRFYLGLGGLSFSGSLHPAVSVETLTDTGETREGDAWIFHHDSRRADNGVNFKVPFRVYRCSMAADEAEQAFSELVE